MAELNHFRTYEVAEDENGQPLELFRDGSRVVCLGFDTNRRRFVEITALGDGDSEGFIERAAAAAGQSHPALAPVVDYGSEEGVFFYASDLVDGEPLERYAARVDAVSLEAVLFWLWRLADGAAVLEACGLEAGIASARFYSDNHGRVSVRIVNFGIAGTHVGGALGDELAKALRMFTNYQGEGEAPVYPPEVEPICQALHAAQTASEIAEFLREQGGGDGPPAIGAPMRPKLLLERELFHRSRPEHVLPDRYRPVRRAGEISPYQSIVEDVEGGHLSRILVLPPERLVSERMLDVFDNQEAEAQVKVAAFWKHEDFRMIAEDLSPGFHLASWIWVHENRGLREIVRVLDGVDEALNEIFGSGGRIRILRREDVLIEFGDVGERGTAELLHEVPAWRWPEFRVRVRRHPTMRSLTEVTDEPIPEGADQVLAAAQRGEDLPARVVFAWYFNLRNRGLHYQAGELLESLRNVADVTGGQAEALPIATPMSEMEQPEEELPAFPVAPALGDPAGGLYDEDEPEELEISPIAAAMRMAEPEPAVEEAPELLPEEDEDFEEPYTNPIAQQAGVASGDEEPNPLAAPPVVERDVGAMLEEGGHVPERRGGFLLVLFILVAAVAIAAAIAHLTGRAFWLE